jgi:acyl-CoA hydrolase
LVALSVQAPRTKVIEMTSLPKLSAAEAAALIQNRQIVGFSGFTSAGSAKAVPLALAERATAEHHAGREFRIGVMAGASTGPSLDGALARADAISFRTPYQSDPELRTLINEGKVQFFDMHLSMMPQAIRYGHLGQVNWAVVEACDVTAGGGIVLTTSVGASPTFCRVADKVIVELNRRHPPTLFGLHDIYEPADPPYRREIPIYSVSDRIGSPVISVEPSKIAGVVEVEMEDDPVSFSPSNAVTQRIGTNVAEFLARELSSGRIPKGFLPMQAGVGNVSNSVMAAIGRHDDIPPFQMYTEVLQDSQLYLMMQSRIRFASTCALTISRPMRDLLYGNPDFFRPRIILRPQEISNSNEVIRRLGVIAINTLSPCAKARKLKLLHRPAGDLGPVRAVRLLLPTSARGRKHAYRTPFCVVIAVGQIGPVARIGLVGFAPRALDGYSGDNWAVPQAVEPTGLRHPNLTGACGCEV